MDTWQSGPGQRAGSSDGRTMVVLSLNSNVDEPVLAAEYGLVDHVMCHQPG